MGKEPLVVNVRAADQWVSYAALPCRGEANADPKPFVIFNAGCFPCNRHTEGMTSSTSVDLSLSRGEMVILGSQFAARSVQSLWAS